MIFKLALLRMIGRFNLFSQQIVLTFIASKAQEYIILMLGEVVMLGLLLGLFLVKLVRFFKFVCFVVQVV